MSSLYPVEKRLDEGNAYIFDVLKRISSKIHFVIDFTQAWHEEFIKNSLKPRETFKGICDYSVEGLPDPGTGISKVAKIEVEGGQEVYLSFRVPEVERAFSFYIYSYMPSSIVMYIQRAFLSFSIDEAGHGEGYTIQWYGEDVWKPVAYYTAHCYAKPVYVNVKFKNTSTETKYVYINYIAIMNIWNTKYWKAPIFTTWHKLSNETFSRDYVLYIPKIQSWWFPVFLKGDGTNPITAKIYLYDRDAWYEVASFSTTSTSFKKYVLKCLTKQKNRAGKWYSAYIKIEVSTTGEGEFQFNPGHVPYSGDEIDQKQTRIAGSYTSDGDGTTDIITLLDYTGSVKHIGKLMRIKCTGDSNTTELMLVVDGEDFWDFLSDGDTCEILLEDIKKIELKVNDPGGGTTTTVNYTLQYVEEDSFLMR